MRLVRRAEPDLERQVTALRIALGLDGAAAPNDGETRAAAKESPPLVKRMTPPGVPS